VSPPRIVVLMGAYNEERYLDETIAAVLAQTMPNFALVMLNNGSTDDTAAVMQRYERADPRIAYLGAPANLWPPVATNVGLTLAMGAWPLTRWFLMHGADDLMEPDYLEAILGAADAHPDANCVFSPWQWIDHPEKGVKFFPYDPATMHTVHQIPAWKAITRELWEQVGPEDQTIRIGSDWSWALRASLAGVLRPLQLDRPYLSLRVRDGDRKSQSDEVDWPALHGHLVGMAEAWQ
jgi:glycosyltransferase involved in cell wall biosynthesis